MIATTINDSINHPRITAIHYALTDHLSRSNRHTDIVNQKLGFSSSDLDRVTQRRKGQSGYWAAQFQLRLRHDDDVIVW